MTLAVVNTSAVQGVTAVPVRVETHLSNGLPGLAIVGLPEATVRESRERVRSALINSGFRFPPGRLTVNLAPADLPKEGSRFDLPIALGILAASAQLASAPFAQLDIFGELALGGAVQGVSGLLPSALSSRATQRIMVVPLANHSELRVVGGLRLWPVASLAEVVSGLSSGEMRGLTTAPVASEEAWVQPGPWPDLASVQGQRAARRALEIAASGGHHLLLCGPPGAGKSLLAQCLAGIMPPLEEAEALEVAAVHSVQGIVRPPDVWRHPPFRSPHHSLSAPALLGGGGSPRPGEISLAHRGLLFLDELPEFDRRVLECLREPVESGEILVSRALRKVVFPACFQFVAAMNPCPCGLAGLPEARCVCTPAQRQRYRSRISGPLLDRFDIRMTVMPVDPVDMALREPSEDSRSIALRVRSARRRQLLRQGCVNARIGGERLRALCRLDMTGEQLLEQAAQRLRLSMRGYQRVLRVARTLADMADAETVGREHLLEALTYRGPD